MLYGFSDLYDNVVLVIVRLDTDPFTSNNLLIGIRKETGI